MQVPMVKWTTCDLCNFTYRDEEMRKTVDGLDICRDCFRGDPSKARYQAEVKALKTWSVKK